MPGRCQHGSVLRDHDFHPDEPTVRIFRTSSPGVLRLDDSVVISEAAYGRVVLRHYAFADHWFKVNVTTGLSGQVTESGEGDSRFAFNCDIATPMEREGDSTFGVDLLTDVLVRDDAMSYVVVDQDEFGENARRRCHLGGGGPRRGARTAGIAGTHRRGAAAAVAQRIRALRAVSASPGAADAARPGTRPAAAGHPPDLVTRTVHRASTPRRSSVPT